MVIEDIDMDEGILEEEKEQEKKTKERKKYIELIKEFNREAEKINCPFKIKIDGNYPCLYTTEKKFIFTEEKEYNTIYYYDNLGLDNNKELFIFHGGLDYDVFKAIEPILNNIKSKFKIKLKNGKVPPKYKILENL